MHEVSENGRLALLVFGIVLFAVIFAWWMSLAPRPLPADAPADQFSAYRAIKHIEQMAVEPHPGGSHAIEKLYTYIDDQLTAMGVEHSVERPIWQMGGRDAVEQVGAILARIPGTASTGAFAIDAHFDSTPYGPGAADDLSGVAAMLETIRALKAGPPLKNDVMFCFADKEETSGQGGPAVFIHHPWFKEVRAVLGLETRGTAGPALMFETGPENGFLIRQMAQSDAHPRATSIMFDFYSRMPFGSDFTRYKKLGLPGMNVAYIDNFCYYHTKLDNPENVSLASLQHHGYYTLGLARKLGDVSLENCKAPDATYFNTIGSHMIVYPRSWGWPLAIFVLFLTVGVLLYGLAIRSLSIRGILTGMAVYFAATLVFVAISVPASYWIYVNFREHALYRNNMYSLGFTMIGLGLLLLFARIARNRVRPQNVMAGVLVWWIIGMIALQVFVAGGAYAAIWPMLFFSAGLLILFYPRHKETSAGRLAATAMFILPGVFLLVPALVMFTYTLTPLAAPGFVPLILLLAAVLLPQTRLIPQNRHLPIALGVLLLGVLLFAGAVVTNTPSPSRPRQNCLSYAANFDTGESWWISGDAHPDKWTRNFFNEDTPKVSIAEFLGRDDGFTYFRAPAPPAPFGKAVLNVLEDRVEDGRRKLKLFVDSPRDAQAINLFLESEAEVFRAKALGVEMPGAKKDWHLSLQTIPFAGGELELETTPGVPLKFLVREISFSLPDIPDFPPRPAEMMTQPNRRLDRRQELESNHTYSICTYEF